MIVGGIDAGSRAIKIVLLDSASGEVLAAKSADQGVPQPARILALLDEALAAAGCSRDALASIIATGYGRNSTGLNATTITEITCHARGVRQVRPDALTIVDIGGQDSKVIWLSQAGRVRDFVMNDRCAAGTGRFLELVAARLGVDLPSLGRLVAGATGAAPISSTCAVFAETEIVGLLAAGSSSEAIAAGVQASIARRTTAMVGGRIEEPVVFTGGVALVPGMAVALEAALGCGVWIPPDPRMTGALGAALLAAEPTLF